MQRRGPGRDKVGPVGHGSEEAARRTATKPVLGRWGPPFFYGWIIIAVLFVTEFTASGMGGSTVSLFFAPMQAELGWSLTLLTGAVTARGLAGMIVAPVLGPLLDRYGARPILLVGALSAGVSLVLLSRIGEVWQYWLLFAVAGTVGMGGG
jgi:MFS family permease